MLAEKLGMTSEKAEEWIVNLIRNANMDAKIDSAEVRDFSVEGTWNLTRLRSPSTSPQGLVVMGSQSMNIYHQVLEKTKGFSFRT